MRLPVVIAICATALIVTAMRQAEGLPAHAGLATTGGPTPCATYTVLEAEGSQALLSCGDTRMWVYALSTPVKLEKGGGRTFAACNVALLNPTPFPNPEVYYRDARSLLWECVNPTPNPDGTSQGIDVWYLVGSDNPLWVIATPTP